MTLTFRSGIKTNAYNRALAQKNELWHILKSGFNKFKG